MMISVMPVVFNSCNAHMDGQIWFLTRSLQLSSFQAYKLRVTHLYQLKQHNILVSVGQDEPGINPLVRITTAVCWRRMSVQVQICVCFRDASWFLKCMCLSIRWRCGTLIRRTAAVLCVPGYFLPYLETNQLKCLVSVFMKTLISWL